MNFPFFWEFEALNFPTFWEFGPLYLKSKIMYKIYDKNTSGQDKELLNKYFQRWKNATFKDNLHKYKI